MEGQQRRDALPAKNGKTSVLWSLTHETIHHAEAAEELKSAALEYALEFHAPPVRETST
jgi:hypothetical protein